MANRICLCLTGETLEENLQLYKRYSPHVDLVELRADFLQSDERRHLDRFPSLIPVPCILTIRRKRDGGHFTEPESLRSELYSRCTEAGYAFMDLEEDWADSGLEEELRAAGGRVIRSIHCTEGFEEHIEKRIRALKRHPTDLPKAAIHVSNVRDQLRLLDLYSALSGSEKILVGMGIVSFPLRVLASRLGSYLTFSSPPSKTAAAGHADPESLNELYRYRSISTETMIFGVIGNPIMHSFSPLIHNTGFHRIGIDAVYLPFQVDDISDFLVLAENLSIQGCSVTIPLKEAVISHLAQKDESVTAIGACNTLVRRDTGWWGTNTDVPGFLQPLEQQSAEMPGRAMVIGAGGAARAVVYALKTKGVEVLILNRTPERARHLAESFGCSWAGLDGEGFRAAREHSDLIVQTTSVGMKPHTDGDPISEYDFTGQEIVYDIVYNPPVTKVLEKAAAAGCEVIYGRQMLLYQAEHQFRLFTGHDFPDLDTIDLGFTD